MRKESHLLTIRRKHLLPEISRNRLRMSNRPSNPDRNSKSFVLKISAFAYGMVAATGIPCDVPVPKKYTFICFYFFTKIGLIIFHKKPI
jgi:hypothetical protein